MDEHGCVSIKLYFKRGQRDDSTRVTANKFVIPNQPSGVIPENRSKSKFQMSPILAPKALSPKKSNFIYKIK